MGCQPTLPQLQWNKDAKFSYFIQSSDFFKGPTDCRYAALTSSMVP